MQQKYVTFKLTKGIRINKEIFVKFHIWSEKQKDLDLIIAVNECTQFYILIETKYQ